MVFIARQSGAILAIMSEPQHKPRVQRRAWAESPWFWVMIFSAAGVLLLLAFSAKYAARQRRLEMQYYARQEITRRQVEGTAQPAGAEGEAKPPLPGELIIPIWPLVSLFTAGGAIAAAMAWRATRRPLAAAVEREKGAEP